MIGSIPKMTCVFSMQGKAKHSLKWQPHQLNTVSSYSFAPLCTLCWLLECKKYPGTSGYEGACDSLPFLPCDSSNAQ